MYYDFDALGSTVGITNTSGTYVNTYGYLPFGGVQTRSGVVANPFQFIGQWGVLQASSGLDLMRARAYDTSTGRFVTQDPIGPFAGDTCLYRYACNNPVTLSDPVGLDWDWERIITWGSYVIYKVVGALTYDQMDEKSEAIQRMVMGKTTSELVEEGFQQGLNPTPTPTPPAEAPPEQPFCPITPPSPPAEPAPSQEPGDPFLNDETYYYDPLGGLDEGTTTDFNPDDYVTNWDETTYNSDGYSPSETYYEYTYNYDDTEASYDEAYYGDLSFDGGGGDAVYAVGSLATPHAARQSAVGGSPTSYEASAAGLRAAAAGTLPSVQRNHFVNTYNPDGSLASQVEQQYDDAGSLIHVRTLEFSGGGVISESVTDELNNIVITIQYAPTGQPSVVTTEYRDGFTITTDYGANGEPTLSVSGFSGGATTTTTYGPHGDPYTPLPADPGGDVAGNDDWPETNTPAPTAVFATVNLEATGTSVTATAGSLFVGQVAALTGARPYPSDYAANIHWGDGTVSSGTVSAMGSGDFIVSGWHAYSKSGSYSIAVAIRDVKGNEAVATTSALVMPSLHQSTVAVSPARIATGGTASVTLTARDANGAQETEETGGGLAVAFALGGGSATGTFSTVMANGDGTYTAIFTATAVGTNTITATIGGQPVTSPSPSIDVTDLGEIHGTVWNDLNGNGANDPGEPGLSGWTIYLDTNRNGHLDPGEASTVTGADGSYAFTGLAPDTYTVAEVMQSGWGQTYPGTGGQRLFEVRPSGTPSTICELNPSTGAVINSFAAPTPIVDEGWQGLALGPNSLFYIDGSPSGPHTLYELNRDTGAVIHSDIVDAAAPVPIDGLGYLNGKVYIQPSATNELWVWDPTNHVALTPLTVPVTVYGGLTGAADRNVLYATDVDGNIDELNPATGALLASFRPALVFSPGWPTSTIG